MGLSVDRATSGKWLDEEYVRYARAVWFVFAAGLLAWLFAAVPCFAQAAPELGPPINSRWSIDKTDRVESIRTITPEPGFTLDQSSGLNVNFISSISQTDDGRLWIGGMHGIQWFDGIRMYDFLSANGPWTKSPTSPTYALSLLHGVGSRLYFNWNSELFYLDTSTGTIHVSAIGDMQWSPLAERFTSEPPNKNDIHWCASASQYVFAISVKPMATVHSIHLPTGRWTKLLDMDPARQRQLFSLPRCQDNRLYWMERDNAGIHAMRFDATSSQVREVHLDKVNIPLSPRIDDKRNLVILQDGSVWATGKRQLMRIDFDAQKLFPEDALNRQIQGALHLHPSAAQGYRLFPSHDRNSFWLTESGTSYLQITPQGPDRVRNFDARWVSSPNPVANSHIRDIVETEYRGHRVRWVSRGTWVQAFRVSGDTFGRSSTVHPDDLGRAVADIDAICALKNGQLWMVDAQGRLLVELPNDRGRLHVAPLKNVSWGMSCTNGHRLEAVADGALVTITSQGAQEFDIERRTLRDFQQEDLLPNLTYISDDESLLFAPRKIIHIRRHDDEARTATFNAGTSRRLLRGRARPSGAGSAARQVLLYVSDDPQVFMYDVRRQMQTPVSFQGIAVPGLSDFAWIGADQAVGIGTKGELYAFRFASDGLTATAERLHKGGQELGDRHMYCVMPESDSIFWVSTSDGIARFERKAGRYQVGSIEQGVLWSDFNFMACSKAPDGAFWFAGLDGWTRVASNPESYLGELPVTAFWHVGADGVPSEPTGAGFGQDESAGLLRVAIAARGNPVQRPTRVYYKLEGIDKDWRSIHPKSPIEYSGLAAGTYTLRASFSEPALNRGDATLLHVEIRPPWFRSTPALLLGCLLMAGLTWLAVQRRRKSAAQQLAHLRRVESSEQRLSLALHASASVLWDEQDGNTLRTEAAWLGYSAQELSGSTEDFEQLLHPDDLEAYREARAACLDGRSPTMRVEYRLLHRDGHWVWVQDSGRVTQGQGSSAGYQRLTGTFHEITRIKAVEDELRRTAAQDALTGLPNRRECDRLLDRAITACARTGQMLAVLFFDLDQFKHINDSLGHSFGDAILKHVANTLRAVLPSKAQTCRQGGDEFVVMVACVDLVEAMDIAQSVCRIVKGITRVEHIEVALSTSVGMALYPHHSSDRHTLLRYADAAMYMAKDGGRNRVCLFDPRSAPFILERPHIEAALSQGIARGEFELMFQPKVRLVDERCTGFEALLRWRNPAFSHVSLASVIRILESSGLIREVGTWVLEQACDELAGVLARFPGELKMAINVSPRQFERGDFVAQVAQCLRTRGVPASALEFELTESVFVASQADWLDQIKGLRDLGVSVAIDDFGTGYSSLSYLRTLPVDVVKIDKSFIDHIDTDFRTEQVCEAIIHLANNLNLTVVAEGAERGSQVAMLKRMSCDIVQGYYYGVPATAEDMMAWVQEPCAVAHRGVRALSATGLAQDQPV